MLTDRTPLRDIPLRLDIIRQLDIVNPDQIEPAFRYHDPELAQAGGVTVVGERDGRTVRSAAFRSGAPKGVFPQYLDTDRAREWADLPLALLEG